MRALLALLLAAAVAGLAACEEDSCGNVACAPCPPTAIVVVTDAVTGRPVANASVTGGATQWMCSEVAAESVCSSTPPTGIDGFDVLVVAPGYATASAHVALARQEGGNCCPDCFVYPPVAVQLEPLPAP